MRRLINHISALTIIVSFIFIAQSCTTSDSKDSMSDREAITWINETFEEAYKSKDGEAIKQLYAVPGSLIAPYRRYIGNEEVKASFESDFRTHQSISKAELEIENIEYDGDTLIAHGRFHILGVKVENKLPFELEGPYTHKCMKENGEWKILVTSFTADVNVNDY